MDFNKRELKILDFWKKEDIFQKTLKATKNGPEFVFYDGPITVNAQPGIHHVLARVYKDIIPRFKTMQGFHVRRKNGWDTHGLPVELSVEKKLGFKSKKDIENYGIKKFNQECQKTVDDLIPTFRQITERIAYWVDMDNPYITYQSNYTETLWFILKQAWNKGLLYKDFKIVPWCSRCGTALSSHEVALGYKNISENSVYVQLKLRPKQKIKNISLLDNTYLLSWTTTPWTLPGNVALAIGQKIHYVLVKQGFSFFILAKSRLRILKDNYKVIAEFSGKDLEGLKYQPIFNIPELQTENSHQVYQGDFVTEEEGTGIVHIAPMYGADDFALGSQNHLPKIHTVNLEGKFNHLVEGFEGDFVKEASTEKKLINYLKDKNVLFKEEKIRHDYPFCWRCKTPLLYYAKESWFIKMTELKNQLLRANEKINWIPSHLKEGRFGEWLKNVKDWAISRERYWGTPLPIWTCPKCGKQICVGSFQELKKYAPSFSLSNNLHRPYIDEIKIKCSCGAEMKREPYVVDVWFDSGAMPFAQNHWPFAEKKRPEDRKQRIGPPSLFPADYISEAIDQTRGWFYTLLAVSVLLDYGAPYKNVLCLGHVLDQKGEKMSKSKGNIIIPAKIIDKYGADALRWYFFTVNQPDKAKRFKERDVRKSLQKILLLHNSFNFLKFYQSKKDKIEISRLENFTPQNPLDKWILAQEKILIRNVSHALEKYQIVKAARLINDFIAQLSYQYIHWSRPRFKPESPDRQEAKLTLLKVFFLLSKIIAPFLPFSSEIIYQDIKALFLAKSSGAISVHLEKWPSKEKVTLEEKDILKHVSKLEQIISLGLRTRKNSQIKIRQPLSELRINVPLDNRFLRILKNELNVKRVVIDNKIPTRPNWANDKNEEGVKISLNIKITSSLKEEGEVREIVRHIQKLRKKANLKPKDEITLSYSCQSKHLLDLIKKNALTLKKTSNIKSLLAVVEEEKNTDLTTNLVINNQPIKISIKAI